MSTTQQSPSPGASVDAPQSIGSFQLANLIRGRVPAYLVLIGPSTLPGLGPMEKMHLQSWGILISEEKSAQEQKQHCLHELADRKSPKEAPIVLLCRDGVASKILTLSLIQEGFLNAYWFEDGIENFQSLIG